MAENFDGMFDSMEGFVEHVKKMGESTENTKKDFDAAAKAALNSANFIEGMGSASIKAGEDLMSFASGVAAGNTSISAIKPAMNAATEVMSELSKIVPVVGDKLSALTKVAGQAANFVLDTMDKNYQSFQKMSESGLIGARGMEGLTEQFANAGVPLDRFAAMLSKNATDMAFFSGSALQGGQDFADVMHDMQDGSNQQLRHMGFSLEEIGDTVVDFQKMNQLMGLRQTQTTDELAQATTNYGQELDMVAKLTGQTRKEAQANRERLMADTKFSAWQSQMEGQISEESRTAMLDFVGGIQKLAPTMGEGIKDLFASGGVATSEAGRKMIQQGMGPAVADMREQMMAGTMNQAEAQAALFQAALENKDKFRDLSALVGDFGAGIPFQEMLKMGKAAKMSETEIQEMAKAAKKQADEPDPTTKAITDAVRHLDLANVGLNQMAMNTTVVAKAAHFFAESLNKTIDYVQNAIGSKDAGYVEKGFTSIIDGIMDMIGTSSPMASMFDSMKGWFSSNEEKKKVLSQSEIEGEVPRVAKAKKLGVELGIGGSTKDGTSHNTFSQQEFTADKALLAEKQNGIQEFYEKLKKSGGTLNKQDQERFAALNKETNLLRQKVNFIKKLEKDGSFKLVDEAKYRSDLAEKSSKMAQPKVSIPSKQKLLPTKDDVISDADKRLKAINDFQLQASKNEIADKRQKEVADAESLVAASKLSSDMATTKALASRKAASEADISQKESRDLQANKDEVAADHRNKVELAANQKLARMRSEESEKDVNMTISSAKRTGAIVADKLAKLKALAETATGDKKAELANEITLAQDAVDQSKQLQVDKYASLEKMRQDDIDRKKQNHADNVNLENDVAQRELVQAKERHANATENKKAYFSELLSLAQQTADETYKNKVKADAAIADLEKKSPASAKDSKFSKKEQVNIQKIASENQLKSKKDVATTEKNIGLGEKFIKTLESFKTLTKNQKENLKNAKTNVAIGREQLRLHKGAKQPLEEHQKNKGATRDTAGNVITSPDIAGAPALPKNKVSTLASGESEYNSQAQKASAATLKIGEANNQAARVRSEAAKAKGREINTVDESGKLSEMVDTLKEMIAVLKDNKSISEQNLAALEKSVEVANKNLQISHDTNATIDKGNRFRI